MVVVVVVVVTYSLLGVTYHTMIQSQRKYSTGPRVTT